MTLWRVDDDVLMVGDLSPARFQPETMLVHDRSGEPFRFAWDDWRADGLGGWRFGAFLTPSGRGWGGGVVPGAGVEHGDPNRLPRRPLIVVMTAAGRSWQTIEMPNALAHLLHEHPDLRERLRDVARITRLVEDVRRCRLVPRPPHEPLAGHKLDAYLAVERALGSRNWHRRHPLLPPAASDRECLVAAAERHDPHHAQHIVDGWLATAPWPFAALTQ